MLGVCDGDSDKVELTAGIIEAFLQDIEVFPQIDFDPQVIADIVCEFPSENERTQALMKRYNVTESQALLAQRLTFQDVPLYFSATEYHRQVKRLKTLLKLQQEIQDVLNNQ